MIVSLLAVFLASCRWNDDFRQRQQPQYAKERPEPTFNRDSDYYVGDRVAIEGKAEQETEKVYLPKIDEREPIPEIQEGGMSD